MSVITGAGVFLHNKKKVLLVYQKVSKLWSLPKGCKEKDECNDECWRRELEEETGISYLPFHKVTGNLNVLRYNITVVELFTDYLSTPHPKDDEIIEARWVSLKDALRMKLNAVTKYVLKTQSPPDPFEHFKSCKRMCNNIRGKSSREARENFRIYEVT